MGPLTRTVILIWGSSLSRVKLGREFLDYILRDGWIDIAGRCANTISDREGGACGVL